MVRNVVERYIVVLLIAVLGAIASYTIKAASTYASIVLCYVAILVALKALHNIAFAIK